MSFRQCTVPTSCRCLLLAAFLPTHPAPLPGESSAHSLGRPGPTPEAVVLFTHCLSWNALLPAFISHSHASLKTQLTCHLLQVFLILLHKKKDFVTLSFFILLLKKKSIRVLPFSLVLFVFIIWIWPRRACPQIHSSLQPCSLLCGRAYDSCRVHSSGSCVSWYCLGLANGSQWQETKGLEEGRSQGILSLL